MQLFILLVLAAAQDARPVEPPAIALGGRRAVVRTFDQLPYAENDYSKRFRFDTFDNPRLKELREKYRLDEVVAPGRTEFDRQVLLLDWVHETFRKFGRPTSKARGALDILKANAEGHTFFCAHYGDVLVSAAASLGWIDRALALKRPDHLGSGAPEHTSTEIWSNQFGKWVMFDPTFALWVEKGGVPLNAYELRTEWFHRKGKDLEFVFGKKRERFRVPDLPVVRKRFPGFGDLALDASTLHKYAFIGYIPNTDLLDSGPDYGKMFIVQDAIGGKTKWHRRTVPEKPAEEPYFPIQQAAFHVKVEDGKVRITLRTMTPNFLRFEVRRDGGDWKKSGASFLWELHAGRNRLEARSVNRFGVPGRPSIFELDLKAK